MSARIKAFAIHLVGSIILAACALVMVFQVWYPAPLEQALGVTHIFLLMLGIDVILGPILTLIIFKKNTRLLKIDLTIIIVVQLIVFSYGLTTVAKGRPAWLVFSTDQFYLVRVADVESKKAALAPAEYRHVPWLGPQWVAVRLPDTQEQRRQLVSETLSAGGGLFSSPNLYSPIETASAKIQKKARTLAELQQYNSAQVIHTTLAQWPTATKWLPLWTNSAGATVLLNKNNEVVSIVSLNPWKQ